MVQINQDNLRGDGSLPSILIQARTLSEGWHKAMIACKDYGARIETVKHVPGDTLGYDADINVRVTHPLEDIEKNQRHMFGTSGNDVSIMCYILEVTHGVRNRWKKSSGDNEDKKWGYTYNERFVDQLPFVFARIKADWEKTLKKEGKGRITGRDYQFGIWRPGEDIILEQDDPPCWQRGHLRFIQDQEGVYNLNYVTDWRSRDLTKGWIPNNIAQVHLQKYFANFVSEMLQIPIKVGCYTDRSSSLHIYGKYINNEDRVEHMIEKMRNANLEDMLTDLFITDKTKLKRIVAAQTDAEFKGLGKNIDEETLKTLGYDVDKIEYPKDWDGIPNTWYAEPDRTKLARVMGDNESRILGSY